MNHKEVNEWREHLRERVTKIETTMGVELPHISKSLGKIDEHLEKLNNRTGNLENWKHWLAGGVAGLGLVITLIRLGVL